MTTTDQYDYELPAQLIAQRPLPQRADARLMLVDRQKQSIDHFHVRDLPSLLQAGDCLVLNDTKVVPAKLVGRRCSTGGRWQGLFLAKDEQETWQLLCKTRGKLHPGEDIMLVDRAGRDAFKLRLSQKADGGVWYAKPHTDKPSYDLLNEVGGIPLPHYIRRGDNIPADWQTYQTVFAQHQGSVAAPTAGLHFTEALLAELAAHQVEIEKVTLHVGIGTFRPIAASQLEDHKMHGEWCRISDDTAGRLAEVRRRGNRVIAVGTTSVRTLESSMVDGEISGREGQTDLFIHPPYAFGAVDGIMTNFHLPRSTLLVLVSTFAGIDLIKRAYQAAVAEEYRFFSYGDVMLII